LPSILVILRYVEGLFFEILKYFGALTGISNLLGGFDKFDPILIGIDHLIFRNERILSYFEFVLVGTTLLVSGF